jgi:hypothetical protein
MTDTNRRIATELRTAALHAGDFDKIDYSDLNTLHDDWVQSDANWDEISGLQLEQKKQVSNSVGRFSDRFVPIE